MRTQQAVPVQELKSRFIQIDQAAVALTVAGIKLTQGVTVKANSGNSGFFYVVHSAAVSSTNGFELDGGQEIFLPVDDPSGIFIIGSADNQNISWIGA